MVLLPGPSKVPRNAFFGSRCDPLKQSQGAGFAIAFVLYKLFCLHQTEGLQYLCRPCNALLWLSILRQSLHSTFILYGSPVMRHAGRLLQSRFETLGCCRQRRLRGCFLPSCCSGKWIQSPVAFGDFPPLKKGGLRESGFADTPQELLRNSPQGGLIISLLALFVSALLFYLFCFLSILQLLQFQRIPERLFQFCCQRGRDGKGKGNPLPFSVFLVPFVTSQKELPAFPYGKSSFFPFLWKRNRFFLLWEQGSVWYFSAA